MSVTLIRVEGATAFGAPVPLGDGGAMARIAANTETPAGNAGLWECTPGCFRRQVAEAEYSYFIAGEGCFVPDGGTPVAFRAGDAIFFPAHTKGEWRIRTTVRKAYLILT